MRIVYIAGSGRSGSTLLARGLQQMTGAVHVGELRYLWERGLRDNQLCECGRPFAECPYWQEVTRSAFGDRAGSTAERFARLGPTVDRLRFVPQHSLPLPAQPARSGLREWGDILADLYAAAARVGGTDVVIDSSKDPSYLFALRATRRFDLQTVHLVRDPRGVAYSWTRKRLRPEVHWEERYMQTHSPRKATMRWMTINAAAAWYRVRFSDSLLVRYEDFCASPDAVLQRIAEGLALSRSPGPATGHSFSGNPSRFDPAPRPIVTDEMWRTGLPSADRYLVSAISAPLRWRYGYR